ncbi:MAG: protein translocase subunit SecD [Pirellulales bacterium]|nr:protein translocase subunit SecD [Pirellulales bacterium]
MFSSLYHGLGLFADVTVEVFREKMWYEEWYGIVLILFLVFAIPIGLGRAMANAVRMRDYSWKIGLILFAALTSSIVLVVREPNLGIDLGGGTILEYEIDQQKKDEVLASGKNNNLMEDMVNSIRQRLDPAGVRQVSIRESGPERIEIKIPRVSQAEVALLKRKLVTAGNLEFRILADQEMDSALIRRVLADPSGLNRVFKEEDQPASRSDDVHDVLVEIALNSSEEVLVLGGIERAKWVTVEPDQAAQVRSDPDLVTRPTPDGKQIQQLMILGQDLAEWVEVGMKKSKVAGESGEPRVQLDRFSVERVRDDGGRDVLVKVDELNVTGGYLSSAGAGIRDGRVAVDFNFNNAGAKKFGRLTGANVRESGRKRRLGIVLDGELLSAPSLNSVIRDSGQITGDFTQDDVDWLVGVLNAGRLPAALNKEPISEQRVEPTLGLSTIESGKKAIGISLVAIILFMPLYYRFSGLVACFALIFNLVLVLGVMLAIGATFTLPGLAGLVLTVGMAVDANVLIFERIREEVLSGAALRMAIRNGFSRATRTIVDANLTTLITAIVLYVIGKDQLRGFAVTLILGIGMSMFTAIFCSRVIFDIAEKRRWIAKLTMTRLLGRTQIDFIGKRYIAAVLSVAVIGIGLFGVFLRGTNLFDIDFRGGSKIEVVFKETASNGEVYNVLVSLSDDRPSDERLSDLKVVGVGEKGFLVETTQANRSLVEDLLQDAFRDRLQTNSLSYDPGSITSIPASKKQTGDAGPSPGTSSVPPATNESVPKEPARRADRVSVSLVALPGDEDAPEETGAEPSAESPGATTESGGTRGEAEPSTGGQKTPDQKTPGANITGQQGTESGLRPGGESPRAAAEEKPDPFAGGSEVALQFSEEINKETLEMRLQELIEKLQLGSPRIAVSNSEVFGDSAKRVKDWQLKTTLDKAAMAKLLSVFQSELLQDPVFRSSTNVGGQVAGDTKKHAFVALFASLVFIIGYIWVRFQRVTFGFAAVVALVHDVLVTLGVIALSAYLIDIPVISNALQLESFKISLPILAAFLTIIGYSLNDTIVVFDRIREVRGRSPDLTAEIINTSINQTLSRTLLTSLTTLIVVIILYFLGGPGIHGFAFALVIGVIAGTYSSVFIASPVLLLMSRPSKASR